MRHTNKEHKDSLNLLERIGLLITKGVGTMICALFFAVLCFVSLPSVLASHDPVLIVQWIAQTFLQLVLLSIILVGQKIQSRHSEYQADIQYEVNVKAEKQIEEILRILNKEKI